jgi:hypothetical protein
VQSFTVPIALHPGMSPNDSGGDLTRAPNRQRPIRRAGFGDKPLQRASRDRGNFARGFGCRTSTRRAIIAWRLSGNLSSVKSKGRSSSPDYVVAQADYGECGSY